MKKFCAIALMAFAASGASGQMMDGSLSTTNYFPMVDGAHYEYIHFGGPWSSSSMTIRGGQTWAGQAGLYAMHYAYTCSVGASCAPDATDFFGMGPDGVHYYGGTGFDPAGMRYSMMTLTSPEWVLRNPAYPGTMMAGGGYANAGMWTASVQGTGSMMGAQGYMSSYFAQGLETVVTPAGTFANCLHVREQRGSGIVRDVWYAKDVGIVMVDDGTQVMRLAGYSIPGAATGTAGALPFMPFDGLWWNPDESGTGYGLQVQRDVMVMTMFSYTPMGEPVWYYAPGRLSGDGTRVTVSGSLERYSGGQCASCGYMRPHVAASDGAFTIVFTSPTSATIQLPGGRTARIEPMTW